MCTSDDDLFDELDSSVTRYDYAVFLIKLRVEVLTCGGFRRDEKFRELFEQANMKIRRTEIQKGMPDGIYPVRTYALQPKR